LIVGILAKMRGCPAVLLVHDVYPEFLVALGALRQASALNALLEHLFAWTYRSFDRIVVLGRDMKDVVSLKLGEGDRVRIIPNWADVDEIRPVPREENSFRAALGLGDSFVVQFSGNIGRSHDVELLLETAQLLVDAREIKFLFVGYGGKSGLISAAKDKRCQNVLFLPRQPREKLAEMLSASDATAILFVEGMYGLSVPSRMYNVMAAGVPIIAVAHPQSELAQTVQESNCGWVLKARSAESMAALLRNLASEEGLAEAQMRGHAGRKLVCRRYTLEHVLDQYRKLFSGI
jgi:glycosyltransferase involved in cell wall biosynthesis